LFQLCNRSLRVDVVTAIDLTDYVISKVNKLPFSFVHFLLPMFLHLPAQELAKAGKAWKDDFATRPVSTPFALKSAMVIQPPSVRLLVQTLTLLTARRALKKGASRIP
jgi:hypothetical protein